MYAFTTWPTPEEIGITATQTCHAWHERVAVAMVDGGIDEQSARALAWREVGGMAQAQSISNRFGATRHHHEAGRGVTWDEDMGAV